VTVLVDGDNGQVVANYEYGTFGELLRSTGIVAKNNPFRFSTKYQDDEMDFLYYGYRYYNPGTGRWLSRDPIEEKGGINLYGFVGNDPISRIDVLGRSSMPLLPPIAFHCPICICNSVVITFNGNPDFNFGYYGFDPVTFTTYPAPNPQSPLSTTRFGSAIDVAWSVVGDPKGCTFQQNEKGTSKFWTSPGPLPIYNWAGPETIPGKNNAATGPVYVDPLGSNKASAGYLKIELDLTIEFKCISSDKSSMAKTATIKASAIAPFPQGPIYHQQISEFQMQ
jgi:RHS repeat-associated protein